MRTVLHIFLKDIWQTRRLLACWLVLLVVQFASSLSTKQLNIADYDFMLADGPKLTVWTLLHWIGLVGIVFEVLLADRAFGTEPHWKTRPIACWQMAAAKFGFVGLLLVASPTAVELASYLAQGVSVRQAVASAWIPLLGQAYVVSWMTLLALFSRRRTFEVAVLAVLALAAPLGVFALVGVGYDALTKLRFYQPLWDIGWDRAPDYLAYPEAYHLRIFVAVGLLPVVALAILGWQAYQLQQRTRTLQWLGALLLIWAGVPFTLMMEGIATAKSMRDAPVHRFTAPDVGLTLDWKQLHPGSRPFTLLEGTLRQPELPIAAGPLAVVEVWHGHTKLHLTHGAVADARGHQPHFTLPDSNSPRRFSDYVTMPAQDAFVNRALARTNGPLATWLGRHTVLNPVTPDSEPKVIIKWEADRALTNFTHAAVELRVEAAESECRIVGRMPFVEFRAQRPTTNAEPSDAALTDPRYTITTVTRATEWGSPTGFSGGDWAATTARKAVLWHPKRLELLLPTTANTQKDGNHGVLALARLSPLQIHTHTSHFPHTPKGKEPQPGAPGPEWFAEAEVIFISFRHLTSQHHIILVPDVKLPPVPPVSPLPSKL